MVVHQAFHCATAKTFMPIDRGEGGTRQLSKSAPSALCQCQAHLCHSCNKRSQTSGAGRLQVLQALEAT